MSSRTSGVASAQVAAAANSLISAAYVAIAFTIGAALVRGRQVRSNRLGTATAGIFLSCAVGHAFHAFHALRVVHGGHMTSVGMPVSGYEAAVDLVTACIAAYYWSLRRSYGALLQGPTLFEDLDKQRRMAELEERDALASARAVAERQRDTQAAMLQAVIANSQSLIYVKDLDGRYLMANKPFARACSVAEAALLGQTDECLDPALAPLWRSHDLHAQQGEFAVEEWSDGPDGRQFYESVKFPLRDPEGTVYATCGISLDVTQRHRANEEMARARDAALAATAAKSAFLATMSHEIRTPMNAVIGLTGLLLDTDLDEQQRDLMETMRASGDLLLVVINDVLDFSKIEAGELHLEHQPFSLRGCAENAMELVAQAAAGKAIDLVLELTADCPQQVVGDAARLGQVLVNLLNNAVKFTDAGDVLLTISAGRATAGQAALRFAVRDTGIGIPSDRMDRLFQSFSQVDASTTRVYGGTGLGLAISRGLVRAMGGDLVAESELGAGSTFSFTVLLDVSDQPDIVPVGDLAGAAVLVVDDNATNRRILDLQLRGWGMRPTCAPGPEQALQLLADGAVYDAAILDMHMPVMDGDQLAAALRALPAGRALPLVMLRSVGPVPAPRSPVSYSAVLTKPVKLAGLQAALLAALSSVSRTMPLPRSPSAVPHGRPVRVLLAEDNLVNQKVARLMLAQLGCDVDVTGTGDAAVEAITAIPYELVLMDVHMPRMDGLEATRLVRAQLPPDRQPHIVALTASALLEDRQACAEAGMDDYLVKPVRQEQLAAMLDRFTTARAVPATDFDPAVVDALVAELGGDEGLRHELLTSYLTDSSDRMAELVSGAACGDRDAVRRAAHALRSSSSVLGLVRLAGRLEFLEALAAAQDGDLAAPVAVVVQEHAGAVRAMAAQLPQAAATGS